jgi:hypothetical protein
LEGKAEVEEAPLLRPQLEGWVHGCGPVACILMQKS